MVRLNEYENKNLLKLNVSPYRFIVITIEKSFKKLISIKIFGFVPSIKRESEKIQLSYCCNNTQLILLDSIGHEVFVSQYMCLKRLS